MQMEVKQHWGTTGKPRRGASPAAPGGHQPNQLLDFGHSASRIMKKHICVTKIAQAVFFYGSLSRLIRSLKFLQWSLKLTLWFHRHCHGIKRCGGVGSVRDTQALGVCCPISYFLSHPCSLPFLPAWYDVVRSPSPSQNREMWAKDTSTTGSSLKSIRFRHSSENRLTVS